VLATDPEAVAAMNRHGLDIEHHRSRLLTRAIRYEGADLVINRHENNSAPCQ
jgi:protein-tyrosine-phosphatase